MNTQRFFTVLLGLVTIFSCADVQQSGNQIDIEAELAGIEQTRQIFMKAVKEGDGETIGKIVTSDVQTFSPGSDDWNQMYLISQNKGPFPYDSIKMNPLETVIVSDSVAYDFGNSLVYYSDEEGNVVELKDTFLAIMKKGKDGIWRLHREVASSKVPK